MNESLDNFLSNLSQTSKFGFEEEVVEKKESVKLEESNEEFDVSLLHDFSDRQFKQKSILEDLNLLITEDEQNHFKDISPSNQLTESQVRKIFKEEINNFFKDKTLLKESSDPQIIYFKVGNNLFKGNLELVKNV
jgi:hypothetical protein